MAIPFLNPLLMRKNLGYPLGRMSCAQRPRRLAIVVDGFDKDLVLSTT